MLSRLVSTMSTIPQAVLFPNLQMLPMRDVLFVNLKGEGFNADRVTDDVTIVLMTGCSENDNLCAPRQRNDQLLWTFGAQELGQAMDAFIWPGLL